MPSSGDPPDNTAAAADSEFARAAKLFPNSFLITGLKHIADNLCGSILKSMPQRLGMTCFYLPRVG